MLGIAIIGAAPADGAAGAGPKPAIVFQCAADNDLYRVMAAGGQDYPRFADPLQAVRAAAEGAGLLILADGYPQQTTAVAPQVFREAARKRVRLYVEYPAALPGMSVGPPRPTGLERVVVASGAFGASLEKLRILAIHDCHFVETKAARVHLVAAKVAGFDTAVYGLADTVTHPILFEHPDGQILVSTTKLSQFVTARYATSDAMQAVWRMVLGWLQPGGRIPALDWTPTVRPAYARAARLPAGAARRAIVRGVDWHSRAKLLLDAASQDRYAEDRPGGQILRANTAPPPPDSQRAAGDGRFGVLEGFASQIDYRGRQPVRWWLRTDSNGESTLAFALRSKLDGDPASRRIAANLADWVYLKSPFCLNDPARANFGLLLWGTGTPSLYGDNDIKAILGCLGTAALLDTDRWDEALLKDILGNFRTTGIFGFRGCCLHNPTLLKEGWRHYHQARTVHFAPHYEAWIWASYLWLYDKTKYRPLLELPLRGIRRMMAAYPDNWEWTNGIQQERGRMLLPLAWLVRVDDRPEYRAWLKRLAGDIERCQDSCGAIREELGAPGKGTCPPTGSNADYGRFEASLIQENGDPVADLLYTCNFTFLGLHEAAAATGDQQFRRMADKLAEFLVRIQIRSEAHPELDGGWFRAFDFHRWDYWGSNADAGWGAWSIEVGWTQAWIPTVLALRELGLNLWDLTGKSRIARHWEKYRSLMLGDEPFPFPEPAWKKVVHAAIDCPVELAVGPSPGYRGFGASALTDGCLGEPTHAAPEWLGFLGDDLDATVDLRAPREIRALAVHYLVSTSVGVFPPRRVEFAVSDDGRHFATLCTVEPEMPGRPAGPSTASATAGGLNAGGRYVRVRAVNLGMLPGWMVKQPIKAWLFVDEILVNP
jgi:hypothetical protein